MEKKKNLAHYLKQLFFSVKDVFSDMPQLISLTPEAWNHPAGQRRELTGIFIWMSGANRWWMSELLVVHCHWGQEQYEGEMERSLLGFGVETGAEADLY